MADNSQKAGIGSSSEVGYKCPPKNRQFGQPNGNRRNSGAWKKEDTPRFKLEQMMKMSEAELKEVIADKEKPYFERKLAIAIAHADWRTIEAMTNQVYGKPKETVETIDTTPKEIKIEVLKAKANEPKGVKNGGSKDENK